MLKDLVRSHKLNIVFLCETLVMGRKIKEVRAKLGYEGTFTVDRVGRSDGLALLWRKTLDCTILSYSKNHIDVEVQMEGRQKWRLTGYYKIPD